MNFILTLQWLFQAPFSSSFLPSSLSSPYLSLTVHNFDLYFSRKKRICSDQTGNPRLSTSKLHIYLLYPLSLFQFSFLGKISPPILWSLPSASLPFIVSNWFPFFVWLFNCSLLKRWLFLWSLNILNSLTGEKRIQINKTPPFSLNYTALFTIWLLLNNQIS